MRIELNLRDAFTVAQVDEKYTAVVTDGIHPAKERDGRVEIGQGELGTVMGALHDKSKVVHLSAHGRMTANLNSVRVKTPSPTRVFTQAKRERTPDMNKLQIHQYRRTRKHPHIMKPQSYIFSRSSSIRSVKVRPRSATLAFVVTARPSLVGTVAEFFKQTDQKLSIVWMPSLAFARHRLKWDRAAMVILDDIGEDSDEVVHTLQASSPNTQILVFQQDILRA
jgi:hypothetical protein